MTALAEPIVADDHPPEPRRATGVLAFVTSTDHKRIGIAYMVTAFAFFIIGGGLAEVIRAQLWEPGSDLVSESLYNQVFTMHGSIMLFLFIGPFAFGLANYFVPLQIGARDMAFPRLNALSYWFYLTGGLTMLAGFLTSTGAADFGWTAYTPLSEATRSPGVGADLWLIALILTGLSGVLTGVNVVASVITMRAPGMTMFRMPIFTWNMLVTSVLVLIAFPMLTAAGAMLFADRHFGAHIFDPAFGGAPILWQHLFWFFGHPEVYIIVLPYFGVITEVLPVFSRRPVFGYPGIVLATLGIASLSVGVWAHHMFATGAVSSAYFSGLSMLIAVPTGIKIFNWIGTMWGGSIKFTAAMKFALGFLFTFLLGGLSGVLLAASPIDLAVTDSYFVVAHMHYVLFGGSVFALYAGIYYWFPKVTGRLLDERLGSVHFWMTLIGFHLTFFVQHILGLDGMPRRVASYRAIDGWTGLNQISSIGAFLLGASTLPFLWNVWRSLRATGDRAIELTAGDDPWGGHTLEWATTSPPPPHDFVGPLPPIRSNRPLWDLNHPDDTTAAHETRAREAACVNEQTQWRIFVGIGSFIALIAVIYWFVSYEAAGTVMLALSSGLALFCGVFLFRHREVPDEATVALESASGRPAGSDVQIEAYLPEASIWPFVIGLSAALSLNGLIVGWPYAVPGAALLGLGVIGWVSQGRRRA